MRYLLALVSEDHDTPGSDPPVDDAPVKIFFMERLKSPHNFLKKLFLSPISC